VRHAKNQDILIHNPIYNDILIDWMASPAWAQVRIPFSTDSWMFRKQEKSSDNGSNLAAGKFYIAALANDVTPDLIQIGLGLRCEAVGH
jgi:hypothetical protein